MNPRSSLVSLFNSGYAMSYHSSTSSGSRGGGGHTVDVRFAKACVVDDVDVVAIMECDGMSCCQVTFDLLLVIIFISVLYSSYCIEIGSVYFICP